MPEAIVDRDPSGIPGLWVYDQGDGTYLIKGSQDALEAGGATVYRRPMTAYVPPKIEGVTLRQFQREGISQITAMLRAYGAAILADEMGLGKTVQGAIAAQAMAATNGRKVLIVCPAGVRHQWEAWAGRLGVKSFANLGPPSDPKNEFAWKLWADGDGGWGAVSYSLMDKAMNAGRKPGTMVFDEPHNYMQGRGNTYVKAMWKAGALVQYKLFLTGSPYLAKPAGLWSMLNIGLGMRFGKAREFDARYCNGHQGKYGWVNDGSDNVGELKRRLSYYMVRRLKADVAKELPKVTRVTRWVPGTKEARGAMANMDYSTNGLRSAMTPTLDAKVAEVVDAAYDANAPCVVFCWRREDAEKVTHALVKAKMHAMTIHGEWDAAARAKMVAEATRLKCHVVTTYGASATGLDGLQHLSSTAIYHAIDPVPATILQAGARLDRIGQTLPVTNVFVAMRDSVDELTIDKTVNRLDVYQKVLGQDLNAQGIRDALIKGGLGDITDDKVLQAIFEEMT